MSLISGNEGTIYAKGDKGLVRKAQEDSHGYKLGTPNGDLFVVCDGMGGHVGGAKASGIAVDSIIQCISEEKYATPIEALGKALDFANMQILGTANEHPEFKGMGTTACILLFQDDGAWIAHVGDSRIYLYLGKEKQLHRITKDHSYVQTLVDQNIISDEEAEHHAQKNRITKALGINPQLQPTFNCENRPIHPKNGDIFLICSDGLSGMIPDCTIERVLSEDGLSLQQKGDKLIELAMQGETVRPGGQDNCTLELIEVDKSKWKMSEFKSYNPVRTATDKSKKKDPIPRKNIKKIVIAVIAVIAILLLGGIAYLVWQKSQEKKFNQAVSDTVESYQKLDSLQKILHQKTDSIPVLEQEINQMKDSLSKDNPSGIDTNDMKNKIFLKNNLITDTANLKNALNTERDIHVENVNKVKWMQNKNNKSK